MKDISSQASETVLQQPRALPLVEALPKAELDQTSLLPSNQVPKNITRRSFASHTAVGITSLLAAAFGPKVWEKGWNTFGVKNLESKIHSVEGELKSRYGIDIKVWEKQGDDDHPPPATVRTGLKETSLYLACQTILCLQDALALYPPELIKEHVYAIDLVYDVRPRNSDTVAEGATPQAVTSFSGLITFGLAGRSKLFELHRAVFGQVLEPQVVHHELGHIFTNDILADDWLKLHPNVAYVGNEWKKLKTLPPGFANAYCAHSVGEDTASTAELLFASALGTNTVNDDAILQAKVSYLKDWYKQKSNGKMNERFWMDLNSGKVKLSYWRKQ